MQTPPSRFVIIHIKLPVVIISVSPVVSVTVVLLVRPLAGEVIWSVVPGASVGVAARPASPVVVIFVPVRLVLVVPFSTPDLVAVATVVKFPIPLPVSSVCCEKNHRPEYLTHHRLPFPPITGQKRPLSLHEIVSGHSPPLWVMSFVFPIHVSQH